MMYVFYLNSNIHNFLFLTEIRFSLAGPDLAKYGFYQFQSVLFIDEIVISLETAFWQTSIQSQSVVKILKRSDKY